jgi:hypothetical protein
MVHKKKKKKVEQRKKTGCYVLTAEGGFWQEGTSTL